MHLPRERRASHLLDVTRGHLQAGQRDQAAATLLDADQLAPEEVRCRDLTQQIITDLVRSYPRGLTPMVGVTMARAVGVVARPFQDRLRLGRVIVMPQVARVR
jgi:hypothetical protein